MSEQSTNPTILCLSGHDPSGGAGIQADIESVAAQGCHAVTVITCLTVQDTSDVQRLQPTPPDLFQQQVTALLSDFSVAAIKIGLLGSVEVARTVAAILSTQPGLPIVVDPVLATGGGSNLASSTLISVIQNEILPRASLATPNRHEARLLSGGASPEECARILLAGGCGGLLVTGADESGEDEVINTLYLANTHQPWRWPRLPFRYHGSGCTLAAAAAARLAKGDSVTQAAELAQEYTWNTLKHARHPGKGQAIPDRLFLCHD